MKRNLSRPEISDRKVKRVSEINTRRINKRKYYGVGVEKKEYKETLDYHINHTAVSQAIDDNIVTLRKESYSSREDFITYIVESADFLRGTTEDVVNDAAPKIRQSFEKGTRKAFDSAGDTLPAPDDIGERVSEQISEQSNYVSKLVQDLRDKGRSLLNENIDGLSASELKRLIEDELKSLKDDRSETIAESETVKAAGAGTLATFDFNDVEQVRWVAEIDDRTCTIGAFRFSYNGKTYTSCRELDGESFGVTGNHPVPVENSHPNCRCVLVAVDT